VERGHIWAGVDTRRFPLLRCWPHHEPPRIKGNRTGAVTRPLSYNPAVRAGLSEPSSTTYSALSCRRHVVRLRRTDRTAVLRWTDASAVGTGNAVATAPVSGGRALAERAAAQVRLLDRRRHVCLVEGADVGSSYDAPSRAPTPTRSAPAPSYPGRGPTRRAYVGRSRR
jgi:hypothetical protein